MKTIRYQTPIMVSAFSAPREDLHAKWIKDFRKKYPKKIAKLRRDGWHSMQKPPKAFVDVLLAMPGDKKVIKKIGSFTGSDYRDAEYDVVYPMMWREIP